MERTALTKKRGRPKKAAAQFAQDEANIQSAELVPVEEIRSCAPVKHRGRLSSEELCDTNHQLSSMQELGGNILFHFSQQIKNKELDFKQELELFKIISPYLGYDSVGNKTAEDKGLDAYARKYVEVSQRIKVVERKCVATTADK